MSTVISNYRYERLSDTATFNADISSWDTSSVTTMASMFMFNQNISSWDVSSVTAMGDMFNGAAAFKRNNHGGHV
jgi:surface protein